MSSNRRLWSFIIMLMTVTQVFAQVTTSSMSGSVTDGGTPVVGARVVATHVPSGTVYNTTTNADGRFNINGMRVGSPYEVTISREGNTDYVEDGIVLALGENFVLNATLDDGVTDVQEVVVTAQRTKFTTAKTGASTNISNTDIINMPSINRSISDVAKLSPYASGMSIAGGDGRSTNFTIDGANFNNNFGLSSNLPGGGNPISLDAIEEIQVAVAPFDVRQTNFIGGGINAITKSGTNTLKGTLYTYFNTQAMRGNKINGQDLGDRAKEATYVYGGTLGGPIIKNKLFFFVNAEYEEQPQQVVNWKPSTNGVADTDRSISRTTIADMQRVGDFLRSKYGYDPGSYTNYPADLSNLKILARIDWNITDAHKLSLRYNRTKNTSWFPTNGNSVDVSPRLTYNRISQYSMAFSNSLYSQDNLVNSFSLDLNSRLSDNVSNQLLATYTNIEDLRGSNSAPFPMVDIMAGRNPDGSQILEPYMSFGYELFTWNNGVHNKIFTITDNLSWSLNSHNITAGFRFEHQMADNAYMRSGTGYYRYSSVDDFLNGAAPEGFSLTYGYDGEANPAAEVKFNQYGLYLQDDWDINDRLKITYGTRADLIQYADNLLANNKISALDFGGRHIDVGSWPKSSVQFSPRLGFVYNLKEDRSMKLRGGTGIFTGRLPLVFFTNMPTNSGMIQGSAAISTSYDSQGNVIGVDPRLALLQGGLITDTSEMISVLGLPNTISPDQGELPREIAAVDPDFKMPQVWKSSLGLDFTVPTSFPLSVTLEGTYTRVINDVMLQNYDIKGPAGWATFNGPDNRYMYPAAADRSYNNLNAYVLANTKKGWGATGNITVHATPTRNLDLMAAYTYTESKEITGMPGSNAASAYGGLVSVNGPFLPDLERSQYVTPHKVIGSLNYSIPYANDHMKTYINLFYTGNSAAGYSYTYSNDMNGDGWANDLIYIPNGRGDILFKTQADEDAYFDFASQDKYLSNHKGEYAGANAVRAPWVHRFDLRIMQEFKVRAGGQNNRLQLSFDILNVGNLLNSSWGVNKNMYPSNSGRILTYEGVDGNNTPIFSFNKVQNNFISKTFDYNYYYREAWRMQIGLKYIFN